MRSPPAHRLVAVRRRRVLRRAIAVMLAAIGASRAFAQRTEVSAASAAVSEWRRVMNAGALPALVRFHLLHGAAAEAPYAAGEDFSIIERGGALDSMRFLRADAGGAELLVRLRRVNEYRVLSARRSSENTFALSTRSPTRSELREELPATEVTLMPRIRAQVERVSRAGRFNGALLIARHGRVVVDRSAGMAHRGSHVPIRSTTRFNIASVGKMFTGIAIARLIEAGRLTLDTPVGAILPDYPTARVRDSVTIRMLLAHRAGLPNVPPSPPSAQVTLDTLLAKVQLLPLDFPPDSMTSYSNSGYLLLGRIIERVTGQSYWAHLDVTIFRPLGMGRTGPCSAWLDLPDLAQGYTYDRLDGPPSDTLWNNTQMFGASTPAGGTCSTTHDLMRFMRAVSTHRLIGEPMLRTMRQVSGTMANAGGRAYGLGFELTAFGGEQAFGHTGGHPGITAYVMHFPRSGYTVIAISNRDREASRLGSWIGMLIGDTVPPT